MKGDNLYGKKIYSYVTNLTQEIDTIEDFEYIEYLIKNKKYV
jgi:CMP-N-acetylneuraminic acid synthetase